MGRTHAPTKGVISKKRYFFCAKKMKRRKFFPALSDLAFFREGGVSVGIEILSSEAAASLPPPVGQRGGGFAIASFPPLLFTARAPASQQPDKSFRHTIDRLSPTK